MTTTAMNETIVNGIDVSALRTAIESMTENPALAQTNWTVHSRWMGGTRTDHAVKGYRIGGNEVDREFTLRVDEPLELGGTNQFANPQEYLLSALNACMMVGYATVAAVMGIKLTRLEVRTTGDIDLRGLLSIDPNVAPGYEGLEQEVHIAGDGTPDQFQKMHEIVRATSPNYFNITRAVSVKSQLMIEDK